MGEPTATKTDDYGHCAHWRHERTGDRCHGVLAELYHRGSDRCGRKILYFSAYGTADYDGNGLEGLIDGRGSGLMWHGDYAYGYNDPTYGQYIDIALDSSISHFAYSLWTRYENANGAPVTTHIYASTDGSTWHLIGIVSNEFTEGDEEYDSGVFSYREPYNYVRIAVTESNAGSVTATAEAIGTAANWKFTDSKKPRQQKGMRACQNRSDMPSCLFLDLFVDSPIVGCRKLYRWPSIALSLTFDSSMDVRRVEGADNRGAAIL